MRLYAVLCGAVCLWNSASAQDQNTPSPPASAEPEYSLDDLLRRARETHPLLRAAAENLRAAEFRAAAAGAAWRPNLQIVPGVGGTREARDEEIILAQPLDVFGVRRARRAVAEAETRRAQAENSLAARNLIIEVKSAALSLFTAQEAERISQELHEIARQFREAAARRAELGDVPPVQVQRAQLQLLQAQNELENARSERNARRAALNVLIGQSAQAPLRVRLAEETAPETVAVRPDIAGAQASLAAKQAQAEALRRENRPTFEVQARRAAVLGGNGSLALRAVINVPLSRGSAKAQQRALEAETKAQAAAVQVLQQRAAAQSESARLRRDGARQNAARFRESILPLTLELLRKTQIGYAQGASSQLDVLEAQRTLRQVQNDYLQALTALHSSELALEAALLGGSIEVTP